MFTDKDIESDLLNVDSCFFSSKHILDRLPVVFENSDDFIEWKHDLSKVLGIDPRDIIITGSACLGYSLNPNKNFKQFNEDSDIDIGIISFEFFSKAWSEIRTLQIYNLENRLRNSIINHKEKYIYYGTIAMDQLWAVISFGRKWNEDINSIKNKYKDKPIGKYPWKYRIYADNRSFRDYQIYSIEAARDKILEKEN